MQVPAHKTKIMVHCPATPPSWGERKSAGQMVTEVRLWHTRDRGNPQRNQRERGFANDG